MRLFLNLAYYRWLGRFRQSTALIKTRQTIYFPWDLKNWFSRQGMTLPRALHPWRGRSQRTTYLFGNRFQPYFCTVTNFVDLLINLLTGKIISHLQWGSLYLNAQELWVPTFKVLGKLSTLKLHTVIASWLNLKFIIIMMYRRHAGCNLQHLFLLARWMFLAFHGTKFLIYFRNVIL